MKQSKKNAFTLIELVAVLVIMAIIALIVTPLVMSIIRKARISADKRSIDAYGRSIELAIAGYLMDNGSFPTSIDQLTIEYSGDEVVCETTQINPDRSVYLSNCKVNNRDVTNYTYGSDKSPSYEAYSVGNEVTYNNVDYYVIKDSGAKESNVTLLKAEPLTVAEVNQYGGVGTANSHVNMCATPSISGSYYRTAYNRNGYGGMSYYTSETCGYSGTTGCTTDYEQSDIKYVVDAWKTSNALIAIEARLITKDELVTSLGYVEGALATTYNVNPGVTPTWVYNSNYWYWTMSQYNDSVSSVWRVGSDGKLEAPYDGSQGVVRPVIVLPKSAID